MLSLVVVAGIALNDAVIVLVVRLLDIYDLVAVYVVGHEGPDICLIVVQVDRGRTPVVGREMTPVPGRVPAFI